MNFSWVTIQVKDMEKSIQFYQDVVGLRLDRRFSPVQGMDLAFLQSEDTKTEVELVKNEQNPTPGHSNDISLGFRASSIEEIKGTLKDFGIEKIEGPYKPNENLQFIYASDPNGVKIQFIEDLR